MIFAPPVRRVLLDFMSAGLLLLLVHLLLLSFPDLNCKLVIAVVSAGPEQQAQDQSCPAGPRSPRTCREISDRLLEIMSEDMPDRMSEYRSDRMSENMSDRLSEYL